MPNKKRPRPRTKQPKARGKQRVASKAIHTILPRWIHWSLFVVLLILGIQSFMAKEYYQGGIQLAVALVSLATSFYSFTLVPWIPSWERTTSSYFQDGKNVRFYAPFFLLFFSLVLFGKPLTHPGMTFAGVDMQFLFPWKVYWTDSIKEGIRPSGILITTWESLFSAGRSWGLVPPSTYFISFFPIPLR